VLPHKDLCPIQAINHSIKPQKLTKCTLLITNDDFLYRLILGLKHIYFNMNKIRRNMLQGQFSP